MGAVYSVKSDEGKWVLKNEGKKTLKLVKFKVSKSSNEILIPDSFFNKKIVSMSPKSIEVPVGHRVSIKFSQESYIQSFSWKMLNQSIKRIELPNSLRHINPKCFLIYSGKISVSPRSRHFMQEKRGIIYQKYPFKMLHCDRKITRTLIRESVKIISPYSMAHTQIRTIVIPSSVETIGSFAFYNSLNLISIRFKQDSRLDIIGRAAFKHCVMIKSIKFPDNLKRIECNAFENCLLLEKIILPQSLIDIDDYAFKSCHILTYVSINKDSKLERMGKGVFENDNLKSIDVPQNITQLDFKIFGSSLETIYFGFNSKLKTLRIQCLANTQLVNITIPKSVGFIKWGAFANCYQISSVKFMDGSNLHHLNQMAFINCKRLRDIYAPKDIHKFFYKLVYKIAGRTNLYFKCNKISNDHIHLTYKTYV